MSVDFGLRGLPLLDAVISQIETHPERWHQGDWRCGSGLCVAGWTAELAGGRWLESDPESWASHMLVPEPDDPDDEVRAVHGIGQGVGVAERAQRLLGLEGYEASELFAGANDLSDIKAVRNRIAARMARS